MKNHKVLKAKFHTGVMAGGRVYSSVDEKQGFQIEMWPMGLFVKGSGPHAAVSEVITYSNVYSFGVEEVKEAQTVPPTKQLKAAK